MSTINTFIQFINDNWNQKVTVYQSDSLVGYTPGTVVDPNNYNGEPVFGMSSNIFFDVESNSIYYYTDGSEPWKKFGDTLSSSFAPDAVNVGIDIGHIEKTETAGELSGLTLSDIIGKLLFKEYQPEKLNPFVAYSIKSNSVDISDSWFEVGSSIPITFEETTDFGKWYIPKLELSTSNYALGFNTTPYSYEKRISGTYTPISSSQSIDVEPNENLFRVKANLKGVHARITNFGNIVTGYEENPTAVFSTDWVEKTINGGYYLFIGSSINPDILAMNPRDFVSLFSSTAIYTGTKQFKVSAAQKYIVVYMMGNKLADRSYKLNQVSESGDIIESNIRFNQIPELVQIPLPDGTNVTYTKHVTKFIQPVSNDIYFQLTI